MNILSLEGKWNLQAEKTIYNTELGLNLSPTVTFPGDIQSALLEANPDFDPYYRDNELKFQVPGQTYWTCTRTINVPKKMLKAHQFIEFDGIDTFADIYVNDIFVGHTENFFRLWRFDITGILQEGENTIQIKFTPSEAIAIEEAKKLPYPIPCSVYDVTSPNRNLVRKTQCQAGWDWGPCIMAMGVYNSLKIIQTDYGFIDYVQTKTIPLDNDEWQVEVTTHIYGLADCVIPVSVCINGGDIQPAITGTPVRISVGENVVKHTLTVKNPDLWWPAGCRPEDDEAILKTGKPTLNQNTLYDITVTAADFKKTQKLGFRTLDVVAKEDEYGKSLYFKVNGRSLFSKGANWIPCDALPSRQTPEKYQYLLESLINANQNTVRVWGGGFYEKDILFEDENLIFINKPSFFPVEKTIVEDRKNLHQVLIDYLWKRTPELRNPPYVGIMHRLDKDTSGVIVFTKNRPANKIISETFQTHNLTKEYVAFCPIPHNQNNSNVQKFKVGDSFTVEGFMGRISGKSSQGKWGFISEKNGGQYSKTDFIIESKQKIEGVDCFKIKCTLYTGRTHQIRVHLSQKGLSILGDKIYGSEKTKNAKRLFLHAQRLAFANELGSFDIHAEM